MPEIEARFTMFKRLVHFEDLVPQAVRLDEAGTGRVHRA